MTTTPQHLLFFGEDWGRHPSTAQYLALELLDDHTVTWVNSIGLREPSLSKADFERVIGKIKRGNAPANSPANAAAETAAIQAPQHLLSPWIVPFHRVSAVRRLNAALFRRQLSQFAHLTESPYSVVTANPASYYLLDQLKPSSSLYYCADKYAHIAGLNPKLVERFERELLTRVDTVVATSKPLVDDLAKHHRNVHYLPHGVDFARFNSTLLQPTIQVRDIAPSGRSTIGFIGLLGEHIDFELIAATARALPAHTFLFVGPVEQGVALPEGANIEYVGAVPQEALPRYLARMDVCTLPYAHTERNHYANPTKVREYLAAGRAVVATRQPGLQDITGEVSVVDDAQQYVSALKVRLGEIAGLTVSELAARREAIAEPMRAETWGARAKVLRGLL